MLELKHGQAALANGSAGGAQTRLALTGSDRVYAYARTKDANTVLVALNFGDAPATVRYESLPRPGVYTDWFDHSKATLDAAGSLALPAHGWRVLVR